MVIQMIQQKIKGISESLQDLRSELCIIAKNDAYLVNKKDTRNSVLYQKLFGLVKQHRFGMATRASHCFL